MTMREPHQGNKWKVDNKDTKPDREKQQGFIFLGNGQVYEKATYPPHNNDIPMEIKYSGCVEGPIQHVQYFITRHGKILYRAR